MNPIKKGEVVLQVPTKVALVDTEEDSGTFYEVSCSVFQGCQTRLCCVRLVRKKYG